MKIKPSHTFPIISKHTVTPDQTSTLTPLKLSVSDLPMLSCHYIQKGVLLPPPPLPPLPLLRRALSRALSLFPPLAGRLSTDPAGHVRILSNDAGADLIHADASHLRAADLLNSPSGDVPDHVRGLFAFDGAVSYAAHFRPILAVQVTELADGVFIACSVSHAVVDGTSFWNFFNTFAEVCNVMISKSPDFNRDSVLISDSVLRLPEAGFAVVNNQINNDMAEVCRGSETMISKSPDFRSVLISDSVLRLPDGGFSVDFGGDDLIRERIFSFSDESISKLNNQINNNMAEVCRGSEKMISKSPDFDRESVLISDSVLRRGFAVDFGGDDPIRERIFSFSGESILKLKSETMISKSPDFRRESVLISDAVLRLPEGGFSVDFGDDPIRERIFSFSGEAISKLKSIVNDQINNDMAEVMGKQSNDKLMMKTKTRTINQISSFQSLCALLWRAITRARRLPADKTTTFRMAVNCRHRLDPKLEAFYFGNAIQSAATAAAAGEVEGRGVRWCAERLNATVAGYGGEAVREYVAEWEREPRCFPLGNAGGGMVVMGSSPRFPMYENDFGWGRPVAVRSGQNNKFDGKISAFPGREGGGAVDLEVVLAPGAMAGLESDPEFMQYVTVC